MILDIQFAEIQRIGGINDEELNAEIAELKANNQALQNENEILESSNEALQSEKASLETRCSELEASIKPEQEKTVDITENGTTEVLPDENKTLSRVAVNVNVPTSDGTEELENFIDESKVLGTFEGTATEKVEQLIDKAENYKWLQDVFAKGADIRFENAEMTYVPDDLDFSNLTVMEYMFANCKNLVQMPEIDTKNVTDLSSCWSGCEALSYLPPLDLSNCININSMVKGCSNLKVLTLYNTEKVTTISEMVNGCSALETISELNAENITRFGSSWQNGCNALKNISFVAETIKVSITFASTVLSLESAKSIILGLKNYYNEADNQYLYTITLPNEVWAKLDAEGNRAILSTEIGGWLSWKEYVDMVLCWNR